MCIFKQVSKNKFVFKFILSNDIKSIRINVFLNPNFLKSEFTRLSLSRDTMIVVFRRLVNLCNCCMSLTEISNYFAGWYTDAVYGFVSIQIVL